MHTTMAEKTNLNTSIEKIKRSMKLNRISSFYLFANDYHPEVVSNVMEEVKNLIPSTLRGRIDNFLGNQLSFAISQVQRNENGGQETETCYLRGIEVIGDELLFTINTLIENENNEEHSSNVLTGQTLDDLMRIAQNQGGNINVENALNGIANNVINNPIFVAVNRVAHFNPDMA